MNQAPVQNQHVPVYYDADYIKSLFEESGHTILSLAHATQHSPTTVSRVLRGKQPTFKPVYNIVIHLNGSYARTFAELPISRVHRAATDRSSGGAVSGRSTGGVGRSKHR